MMYYPKSQIKTNQTTLGREFQLVSSKKEYKGSYWSTSKGEYFTGKSPKDSPNERLEKISSMEIDPSTGKVFYEAFPNDFFIESTSYYAAKNISKKPKAPRNPISTFPSNIKGNFTRYFASKTNEITFIEISKNEYDKLKNKNSEVNWTLYEPIKIEWMVEGTREEVYLKNKSSVLQVGVLGFEQYFREKYDKFWLG